MTQATDRVTGKHFICRDGFAQFFSVIGRRMDNGTWGFVRPDATAFRIMDEWDPEDELITKPFEYWLKRGAKKKDRFTHLYLSPTYGVLAILGGRLTPTHLRNAKEYSDHIDVSDVDLGLKNHRAMVRIFDRTLERDRGVMAADSQGKAL